MLQLTDFSYTLPPELIAQSPLAQRDRSKLLVLDRNTQALSHQHFWQLPALLRPGDVLVRNNTKVIPVRLHGSKKTGGKVEVVLLKKQASAGLPAEIWECLTKPGLSVGQEVFFDLGVRGVCIAMTDRTRTLAFDSFEGPFITILEKIGATPIPPYIHSQQTEAELREAYQTIYAKELGSVAAPTAGLHFTPELDSQLEEKGVQILEVTLHVGLGTFATVKTNSIANHHMHSEWFELSTTTAQKIMAAKAAGNRIIAVGTTTTRVLEATASLKNGVCILTPQSGETAIFIYPPYQFKCVDGLITNFHLPESTLLMLISALVSQPNTPHVFTNFLSSSVGKAYQKAVVEKYRFFSFGDAMLLI